MDAEYYDDLAGRLYGLLIVLEDRLGGEQAQLLHHFIEVSEYGLALEEIAGALAQERTAGGLDVSPSVARPACGSFRIRGETWHAGQVSCEQPPRGRMARLFEAADRRHVPLRTILVTVGVVVATYLAGKLLYLLRDIVLLMLVAGFVAMLLNPAVIKVQRRIPRRGLAVMIVTLWAALVFIGLAAAFGVPLVNGITHLAGRMPGYVASAQHGRGWIGHLVTKYHIQAWVQRNTPKLVSYAQSFSKPALAVGKGAVFLIIELLTLFVLVLLLLLEGPKMWSWTLGQMTPGRRATVTRIAGDVSQKVTGYMFGNLLTSLIAGIVVFVTLLILGVPFPLLWGLWVALVDFLPMIGGALAGIPTVLFAFIHSLTAGIVTAVVFLVYTQVENHVLNPVVMSKTVRINPLLVFIAVLVGASLGSLIGGIFGGFVAALLAIPTAGALQVLVKEVWQATAPDPPQESAAPPREPQVPPAEPEEPAVQRGELSPVSPDTREHDGKRPGALSRTGREHGKRLRRTGHGTAFSPGYRPRRRGGTRLSPLTADRAKPAVPFGGLYRLIAAAIAAAAPAAADRETTRPATARRGHRAGRRQRVWCAAHGRDGHDDAKPADGHAWAARPDNPTAGRPARSESLRAGLGTKPGS